MVNFRDLILDLHEAELLKQLDASGWQERRDAVNELASDKALVAKHEEAIVKKLVDGDNDVRGAAMQA